MTINNIEFTVRAMQITADESSARVVACRTDHNVKRLLIKPMKSECGLQVIDKVCDFSRATENAIKEDADEGK